MTLPTKPHMLFHTFTALLALILVVGQQPRGLAKERDQQELRSSTSNSRSSRTMPGLQCQLTEIMRHPWPSNECKGSLDRYTIGNLQTSSCFQEQTCLDQSCCNSPLNCSSINTCSAGSCSMACNCVSVISSPSSNFVNGFGKTLAKLPDSYRRDSYQRHCSCFRLVQIWSCAGGKSVSRTSSVSWSPQAFNTALRNLIALSTPMCEVFNCMSNDTTLGSCLRRSSDV
jgi:hypothetical protein